MTTREIEAMNVLRGDEVEDIAAAIREKPNRVSETINYSRRNQRIRTKLATYYNIPEERLFDQPLVSGSAPATQHAALSS